MKQAIREGSRIHARAIMGQSRNGAPAGGLRPPDRDMTRRTTVFRMTAPAPQQHATLTTFAEPVLFPVKPAGRASETRAQGDPERGPDRGVFTWTRKHCAVLSRT